MASVRSEKMKGKFAHIADCHIGAWHDPHLRSINDKCFETAIDACIENKVDFVVISGDIFDVGMPEMTSVRSAVRKLRQLADNDISAYVVYGSHDYSPTTVSVVDVITSAGLFVNVGENNEPSGPLTHPSSRSVQPTTQQDTESDSSDLISSSGILVGRGSESPKIKDQDSQRITIRPVTDKKTGARLYGIPARRRAIERNLYGRLSIEELHKEKTTQRDESGSSSSSSSNTDYYSIFLFHASINELQSLNIPTEESVSLFELPRGFSYYAGGHVHKRVKGSLDGSPVVYPGPLFGTSYADLELSSKGEKRGFALVEFEGPKTTRVDFIDLPHPKILSRAFTAEGKSAEQLSREISDFVEREGLDVRDSIVLMKARGTLASGKPGDIDWYGYRTALLKRGALVASINRIGLTSQESRKLAKIPATSKEEIESRLLESYLRDYKPELQELSFLSSQEGVSRALKLLQAFKAEKSPGETRQIFESRMWKEAVEILEIAEGGKGEEDQQKQEQENAVKQRSAERNRRRKRVGGSDGTSKDDGDTLDQTESSDQGRLPL